MYPSELNNICIREWNADKKNESYYKYLLDAWVSPIPNVIVLNSKDVFPLWSELIIQFNKISPSAAADFANRDNIINQRVPRAYKMKEGSIISFYSDDISQRGIAYIYILKQLLVMGCIS